MEPTAAGPAGGRVPPTAEEEALRASTDCIYFLASPLTCKKGSECEYRHSEAARVNPRDCWYWFSGSCKNPKCSFRHPPLDGLVGTTAPSPKTAAQYPTPHTPASVPAVPGTKLKVPCYYFQMGNCLKGNRCAYMHAPAGIVNHSAQDEAKISTSYATQPQNNKFLRACTKQEPTVSVVDNSNAGVKVSVSSTPTKLENSPASNGKVTSVYQNHLASRSNVFFRVEKEAGELSGETSQKYDIYVNNAAGDPSKLSRKKFDGTSSSQDSRTIRASNGWHLPRVNPDPSAHSICQQAGNTSIVVRPLERSSTSKRRTTSTEHDQIVTDKLDLRHHLVKQRRISSSKSLWSPDGQVQRDGEDNYLEERLRGNYSRRYQEKVPREGVSSRLSGRIQLPGLSTGSEVDSQTMKDTARRLQDRLSMPLIAGANFAARSRERERPNPYDDDIIIGDDASRQMQTTRTDDVSADFSSPKRLAELKGTKLADVLQNHPFQSSKITEPVCSEPKALDAILNSKSKTKSVDGENNATVNELESLKNGSDVSDSIRLNDVQGGANEKEEGEMEVELHAEDEIDEFELGTAEIAEAAGQSHEEFRDESNDDALYDNDDEVDYQDYEEEEYDDEEDDFASKVGAMFS